MSNNTYAIILLIVGVYLLIVALLNKSKLFIVGPVTHARGNFSNTFWRISTVIMGLFLLFGAYILFKGK